MSDTTQAGLKLFREIYGDEMAHGLAEHLKTDAFGVELARWSNDFSFGTVWSRGDIERKLRSCTVLGMMIALGQTNEIRYHVKMGIANGLTRQEIEAILYTAVPYCGFPAANTAKAAMLAALQELDDAGVESRSAQG